MPEILEFKIEDIKLNENTVRTTTTEQIEQQVNIIKRFGRLILPVVINSENTVVLQNEKLIAAQQMKLETIPVIFEKDISDSEIEQLMIAELRAYELGEWDFNALIEKIKEFEANGDNFTGFTVESLLKEIEEEMDFSPDEVKEVDTPEPEEEYFTQQGDIYILGEHRLMCGDSTNREDVEKLMNGEKADLMLTDPPYNVNYEGSNGQKIKNDNMKSDEFADFIRAFYDNAFEVMRAGAAFYVFHADAETITFRGELEKAGFKVSQGLIWIKNSFNLSRQDYNWRHEPCLYGWKMGEAHYFCEDYTQDTVLEDIETIKKKGKAELLDYIKQLHSRIDSCTTLIREDKSLKNDIHPTMKPLKLLARLMINSSKQNWNVVDFFGGSGSTLMTAEQLNRKAFLMEFDPKYADVIVKRFNFLETGKEIKLIRNGKTYSWEEIKDNFADER